MRFRHSSLAPFLLTLAFACAKAAPATPPPKLLIDFNSPDAAKQVTPTKGVAPSFVKVDKTGISMSFSIQPAPHSGVHVTPATGTSWDLSAYGHIEAKVTNLGTKSLPMVMHVVPDKEGWWAETNTEYVNINPGETRVLTVYFGYQYGFEPSMSFDPSNIRELYLFLFDTADPHAFRIEELKAAGVAGEKPYIDPNSLSYAPAGGAILGNGAAFDPAKQVEANGVQVAPGPAGALAVNFAGGKEEVVTIKPAIGMWDLSGGNQIRVKIKNTGQTAATPAVAVGPSKVAAAGPIAPGAEGEVTVPFVVALSATDTKFESDKTREISLFSDATPGAKSLLVTSIATDVAIDNDLPDWLGKKPPVEGDWVQTLDAGFGSAPALDTKKWNIYGNIHSDGDRGWNHDHNQSRETHFSKENLIIKDGALVLRFEKKTGKNDDADKGKQTDYASGYLTSLGKWTQRYGYFEARVKLPTTPGLHAAISLAPDRGKAFVPSASRTKAAKLPTDPGAGGVVFSILDQLSHWGPYRVSVGARAEKPLGLKNTYVLPDKDGCVTLGLLWTPGLAVYYENGKEIYRWAGPRVSDIESSIRITLVGGGNGSPMVDDTRLPADLTVEYLRAWQRKDLATPDDGPKPNDGNPDETSN